MDSITHMCMNKQSQWLTITVLDSHRYRQSERHAIINKFSVIFTYTEKINQLPNHNSREKESHKEKVTKTDSIEKVQSDTLTALDTHMGQTITTIYSIFAKASQR